MLKGLALTPPVIGRISIGKIVEKNGKRLPEKDDEFTVTSQVQMKEGWVNHPIDENLQSIALSTRIDAMALGQEPERREVRQRQGDAAAAADLRGDDSAYPPAVLGFAREFIGHRQGHRGK